jgi:hypothetical protein
MTFNEEPSNDILRQLPMRARLKATGAIAPSGATPAWIVEQQWQSTVEQPLLVGIALRLFELRGIRCCAIQGSAVTPGKGASSYDDERAFVYLLNPADPIVWRAIDSWLEEGRVIVHTGSGCQRAASLCNADLAVLAVREIEGEELESDMLAGVIKELFYEGLLETEVATQLGIKVPAYCTVVETPMMCKSLEPADEEAWRIFMEIRTQKWLNESIWS